MHEKRALGDCIESVRSEVSDAAAPVSARYRALAAAAGRAEAALGIRAETRTALEGVIGGINEPEGGDRARRGGDGAAARAAAAGGAGGGGPR